jgi:hypothetical protein
LNKDNQGLVEAIQKPSDDSKATIKTLRKGSNIYRIHSMAYGGDEFNPGMKGNARFSPIRRPDGTPIPTLYGGINLQVAIMETLFHDVPHTAGVKFYDIVKLEGLVMSHINP